MKRERYSIIYSSKTGNTKKLAEAIYNTLPQNKCDYYGTVDKIDDVLSNVIYIGFWTEKGNADHLTIDFLNKLRNKKIFLFGTAGYGESEKYFEDCKGYPLTDSKGKQVFNKFGSPVFADVHPPTITGLALALGFASRQALLNYQTKPEFNDTITRAKARVEQYAEERLFDRDGSNGAQFSLRNNFKGWDADKKNDDSGDGKITIVNNIPRPEKQNE